MPFSISPVATPTGLQKVQHFKVSMVSTTFILLPIVPVNQSKTILHATVSDKSVALSFVDDATVLIERNDKKRTVEVGVQVIEYY